MEKVSLEEMQVLEKAAKILTRFACGEAQMLEYFETVLKAVTWNEVRSRLEFEARSLQEREDRLTQAHEAALKLAEGK